MWSPVPVEFGNHCVEKLPAYLQGHQRLLLVTGRHAMRAAGVTDRLRALLAKAGCDVRVFDQVSAEPNHDEVEAGGRLARDFGATVVLGCGGGSALDAAKAIAVAATHDGPIMDYVINGPRAITAATLPVLAITSTSGTGSHVGRAAVLSDRQGRIKRALLHDELYPRAAFCDPHILKTMSPEVTATTGFDAFAQALEGYLSRVENPLGNLCAQEALRVIHHTLPKVLENGTDLDLRNDMAWGDTLAGISLATNSIVIPHAFSMVLGARYGITHARAIASVFVACLRHSQPAAWPKLARVARLLGCDEPLSDAGLADWAIDAIRQLLSQIGLAKTPRDYGVPEQDFPDIAREVHEVFKFRVEADPVPTDAVGLTRILQQAVGDKT
jgi:alcohol dehydrogenase class IV